jgi:hypothetical protein
MGPEAGFIRPGVIGKAESSAGCSSDFIGSGVAAVTDGELNKFRRVF